MRVAECVEEEVLGGRDKPNILCAGFDTLRTLLRLVEYTSLDDKKGRVLLCDWGLILCRMGLFGIAFTTC